MRFERGGGMWGRLFYLMRVCGKWGGVDTVEGERERERERERDLISLLACFLPSSAMILPAMRNLYLTFQSTPLPPLPSPPYPPTNEKWKKQ